MGQFAKELGPVYLAYGRALLQLGIRNKDGLLNTDAMPEAAMEGLADSLESGMAKRAKVVNLDGVVFEGDYDDNDGKHQPEDEGKDGVDGHGDQEKEDSYDESDKDDENPHPNAADKDDELALAWEILDIARLIYADSASMDEQAKTQLANVHCDLGDVAMETESFSQASDEFNKALELKKSLKVCGRRELAAIQFKLAMALEYDNRAAEALAPFQEAKAHLKARLDDLLLSTSKNVNENENDDKGKEKISPGANDKDPNSEADELLQLIGEVEAKIEDIRSQIDDQTLSTSNGANQVRAALNTAAHSAVQDLSGLVRKRGADSS